MSLGGPASPALDLAVCRSIEGGVTYAVAAGNDGRDACDYSPARILQAIGTGATDDDALLAAAAGYVSEEVPDAAAALQGMRDILAEQVAEDATVRGWVREVTRAEGRVKSVVMTGKASEDARRS